MFCRAGVGNTTLWKLALEHMYGKLADITMRFLAIPITEELMHDADARQRGHRGESREQPANLVCRVVRVRHDNSPVQEGKVAGCDIVDFSAEGTGDDPDEASPCGETTGRTLY
jgi:hypothetical protein